jgi:hypothetical protein
MNQDVLETAKFPDINFQSLEVTAVRTKAEQFRVHILGDLTVHGVTNQQTIVAQVALGLDSLRAFGEFTLLQTDDEIKIASIASGTLKLRDTLKSSFYVAARQQKQTPATAH